jgi:serine/threonine protein kinase
MFQNASGNLLVKLSDFGHSRYLPDQEEKVLIYIPISKPWNAPEHHHRGFRFSQAAKMDIFSFGVCCLWLLFYNSASKGHFILDIDSSRADVMLDLAKDYISLNGELDGEMRATLTLLFEQCLPSRPECRSCTMEPILELLHLMK